MITHLSTYKKIITLATALTVTTACSALEDDNAALLVEKHAEFVLRNKAKIEAHFEVVIKVLESEKYKKPILSFVEESKAPIEDFVLVKALKHFEQSPLDLVLDAPKALKLPRSTKVGYAELSNFYLIPFDPSYIGALTTGYQMSPSAVEKTIEAVEFLIPLYSLLFETLLEFDEFNQPNVFRDGNGSPQIKDGYADKFTFLGSSDERLSYEIPLEAFFPILTALAPRNHGYTYVAKDALGGGGLKHLKLSQLKLLEKVYVFINSYSFYWYSDNYRNVGEKMLSSIQDAISKAESEVVDFSDLGVGGENNSNGAEESPGLDFDDLEL